MKKIDAYKSVLGFVFKFQKGLSLSLEDGNFDISDISNFKEAFLDAPYAFAAFNFLKGSSFALTPEDLAELQVFVVKEFDIKNDKLENTIEDGLSLAISIFSFTEKFNK